MLDDNTLLFLLAYVVGTGFGWWLGVTKNVRDVSTVLIDRLCEDGYLKHRKNADGEIEILKYNEE